MPLLLLLREMLQCVCVYSVVLYILFCHVFNGHRELCGPFYISTSGKKPHLYWLAYAHAHPNTCSHLSILYALEWINWSWKIKIKKKKQQTETVCLNSRSSIALRKRALCDVAKIC